MLNKHDLSERFGVTIRDIALWHAKRVLPEPIRVGRECKWREEDIELFEDYLLARRDFREQGGDPDAPDGPDVPIYSQGIPSIDPREIMAQERERGRRAKSKTLAAGSAAIPAQQPVQIPDVAGNEVRGKKCDL